MRIPTATYRVQLHKNFNFVQVRSLIPYLAAIGISDLYVSPICQAQSGSTHGYDVTDPTRINPELGSPEDFDDLVEDLHARDMGLIVDIVPNHMAATQENPWWMDVLENGSASEHAAVFDIEWGHRTPSMQEKIVLPVLGEPYGNALEEQRLQLVLTESGLRVEYYGAQYPIDPGTYHEVLSFRLDNLLEHVEATDPALVAFGALLETAERLPPRTAAEWEAVETRRQESGNIKRKLWALYKSEPVIRGYLDETLRLYNGLRGNPSSFDRLDSLLDRQPYQLAFWQAARERINYRRFFDVAGLIGIRTQDPQVFQATHELVLRWLAEKKVSGLRVDHIDGLYDPLSYMAELQTRCSRERGEPVYIVVEKILSGLERLPREWPVCGTTGYDFLGTLNNLFVDPDGLRELTSAYESFIRDDTSFYELAYQQKRRIMEELFAGELRSLGIHLNAIAQCDRHGRDLSPEALNQALLDVTASMPVYRTYTRDFPARAHDSAVIEDAVARARQRHPALHPACFDFLRKVLLVDFPGNEDVLRFVLRWQQVTSPVMAKGIEDTTLYLYNRLVSMNDVGGSPEPVSPEHFHEFNMARQREWRATMNATSTHDTKRSQDVRARINLLSEMAGDWKRLVNRWHRANRVFTKSSFPDIDPNGEYLLYQTLLGTWPLDDEITPEYLGRIKNYLIKAAREAKRHTNWTRPDEEYERGMLEFTMAILKDDPQNRFLPRFRDLARRIAFYGALNSLAQTLLKTVCPGVPDFYQGTTLWDFSLVDPDNRRPAQISARLDLLESLERWNSPAGSEELEDLLDCWQDGRVKTYLMARGLRVRKLNADVFDCGEYLGLQGTGLAEQHAVSVARRRGNSWVIAIVPRFPLAFSARERWPLGRRPWNGAAVRLPEGAPERWRNELTGESIQSNGELSVAAALAAFPVALLVAELPMVNP